MKFKKVLPVLAVAAVLPLSACGPKEEDKHYTLNSYLTVCPSNWNELTYQDNNDTEILGYIGGSFFSFDFQYDANGDVIPGGFTVKYDALKEMKDITAEIAKSSKTWGLDATETKNHAFRLTLRDDLKWDDGTPIKAQDFVYTMKQQLDPAYLNYRADSYYVGSQIIHGAKGYAKQGQSGWFKGTEAFDVISGNEENLVWFNGPANKNATDYSVVENYVRADWGGFPASYDVAKFWNYFISNYGLTADPATLLTMEGKTLAQILADPTMKAQYDIVEGFWCETPDEMIGFCVGNYTFPAQSFDDVAYYAEDDYNLVVVLDNTLELFDENGNLTYHCPYEFASMPLVKESLFESCRVAADPATPGALPSYKYNTSLETTASWGPYKLTYFQAGKQYVLEKNPYWYGYNKEENKGKYTTEKIVVDIIEEQATAWQLFLNGDLDAIGISPAIGNVEYKTSSRAYFTASDYIASMQLQSDATALKGRETEGVDKEILTYVDFRKALSLCVDRAEYAAKTTTASLAGFGIFNSMHYYDVANAGVYRNTNYAKKVICDVYGVEYTDANLDQKYASVTGYDINQAKTLFNKAHADAIQAGTMSATDKVVLTFGTAADTESTRLVYDSLSAYIIEGVKGTTLEGKVETEFKTFDTRWATDFRAGAYDICTGGWSGAAWNPGYFLLAYLSPSYMYSAAWDTSTASLTFKPEGASEAYTMSLIDWYNCLNSDGTAAHDWSDGGKDLPAGKEAGTNFRLSIIAALEKEILSVYYTVPLYNSYSAQLVTGKVEYFTKDYNTFMGYGGIKNLSYNYDDAGWNAIKANYDYKA